jgi:hypothetical protein
MPFGHGCGVNRVRPCRHKKTTAFLRHPVERQGGRFGCQCWGFQSLDYLVGSTDILLEKSVVNKILDIQKLKESDKQHVFALLDAFIKQTKLQGIL